jgi:hypothetical protein
MNFQKPGQAFMFDKLFMLYSKKKRDRLDPDYRAEDAIVSKVLLNADASNLAVIFPPWHGVRLLTNIFAKRLVRKGYAVLLYEFNTQILVSDELRVLRSFEYIEQTIAKDISELSSAYSKTRLIGLSLGGVALAMVASKFHDFNEVDFVVAGDDLALCMWYGARTSSLRKSFEHEKVRIRKLDSDWRSLAPENYVQYFAHKRVRLIVSRTDSIIPTSYQKKLKKDLELADATVTCRYTRLGHYLSVVRFCLTGA